MKTFDDLYREYLLGATVPKAVLDEFLDPETRTWAKFDPEVGYVLNNCLVRNGINGSYTISTSHGAIRSQHHYAGKPCRINTYGDSFTECHQVSDGETWQEYLAAHLGEPLGNYGVGGFGVYQAYRRLIRNEATPSGAANVVLYIWGDDHQRSVMRCRYAAIYPWFSNKIASLFHANFWSNIEMDLASGKFIERENLCPSPSSLYRMCDPQFMADSLKDDLMIRLIFCQSQNFDRQFIAGIADFRRLADILGVPFQSEDDEAAQRTLRSLNDAYAFAATREILAKAQTFTGQHGKNLLVVLLDPYGVTRPLIQTGQRRDQAIVDFLEERQINYFDMNRVHAEDFKNFNLTADDYLKRYLIGHYNPAGNHFFAFAIKDKILDMLDPKPITYRGGREANIDFEGYLDFH
jgi:hypothetical protein